MEDDGRDDRFRVLARLGAHLSRKDRRGRGKSLERLDENTTRSAERRTDRRCAAADRHHAATEASPKISVSPWVQGPAEPFPSLRTVTTSAVSAVLNDIGFRLTCV